MAEVTLHAESRVLIRPAIVALDDEENEVVVGLGTAIEVSFLQFAEAVIALIPPPTPPEEEEEEEPGGSEGGGEGG